MNVWLGNWIDSSRIVSRVSHRVSPVVAVLRPMAAPISPAAISFTSLRRLACILTRRPTFSSLPLLALSSWSELLTTPE